MSSRLLTKVWHAGYGDASTVLLLMALADESNDAGECSVNLPSLARKARQSERNCRYILRALEQAHILECFEARGRNHSNRYQLHLEHLHNLQPLPVIDIKENLQPLPVIKPANPATIAGFHAPVKPANPATIAGFSLPFPSDSPSQDLKTEDPEGIPPIVPQKAQSDLPPHEQVLAHLNATLGRKYRVSPLIEARLHGGYTVADCMLVIDWLHIERRREDPEWTAKYLDTETPFRPGHFDKYLQRAAEWDANGRVHTAPPRRMTRDEERKVADEQSNKDMEAIANGCNTRRSVWDPVDQPHAHLSPATGGRRQGRLSLGPQ